MSQNSEDEVVPNDNQKITLADLKLKKSLENIKQQKKRYEVMIINSIQAQKVYKDQQIYAYYCQLCGLLSLVLEKPIDSFVQRNMDNSFCINMRDNKFKYYMTVDTSPTYIKRSQGVEMQFLMKCSECKVIIGYQCISQKEAEQLVKIKNSQIVDEQFITLQNKPYFYIISDSLVRDTKYSKLVRELANIQ